VSVALESKHIQLVPLDIARLLVKEGQDDLAVELADSRSRRVSYTRQRVRRILTMILAFLLPVSLVPILVEIGCAQWWTGKVP
jgi:hypothetical protein